MQRDLTAGPIGRSMFLFALPMIAGNLLQQAYNLGDAWVVGRYIGPGALAAVGASFTLMVFLTSIIMGLCMGAGALFSMLFGAEDVETLQNSLFVSFVFVGAVTVAITVLSLVFLHPILQGLQIQTEVYDETYRYLRIICYGIPFSFLYNFFAAFLRSIGNSLWPLLFLGVASVLNIGLDLLFVVPFQMEVEGAALATVIAQGVSALGLGIYAWLRSPLLRIGRRHLRFRMELFQKVAGYSLLTCVQQSVMNFGILLIQRLINGFSVSVMAAFAAAVKIDAFAYMPVQDFGNAYSTFVAQNYGAKQKDRIRKGTRVAFLSAFIFCVVVSLLVFLLAEPLMMIFTGPEETEIIQIGAGYLRIEGACYVGIGWLFLFYGFYRGIGRPGMSVILTVLSLGTRVLLAYLLAPIEGIGLLGVWWSIPIGWVVADVVGGCSMRKHEENHEGD